MAEAVDKEMDMRTEGKCEKQDLMHEALDKIEKAIEAVERCKGKLTTDGYKALRGRSGHLMDTLYTVGGALSKST